MTDAGIRFRVTPGSESDLPGVAAIAARSFADPWSLGLFASELASPRARLHLVHAPGPAASPAGYLLASRVVDELHVLSLAVEPEQRRRGAATALLEQVLASERARGARVAHLEVRASSRDARAFYGRHGFRWVGTRARYYRDGTDALLLSRRLPAPLASCGVQP